MLKVRAVALPEVANVKVAFTEGGLVLAGSITSKEPDRSLGAFFRAVHDAALADALRVLNVDVRGLTFVNSSAIRLFIDWAIWVSQPKRAAYKLCFVRNPTVTWQRVSFPAIGQRRRPRASHVHAGVEPARGDAHLLDRLPRRAGGLGRRAARLRGRLRALGERDQLRDPGRRRRARNRAPSGPSRRACEQRHHSRASDHAAPAAR